MGIGEILFPFFMPPRVFEGVFLDSSGDDILLGKLKSIDAQQLTAISSFAPWSWVR